MKQLGLASLAFATAVMIPAFTSCSSDANPLDITVSNEKTMTKILLNLDVASTRAEGDLSTDEEKKISKVNVYIFDENDGLEIIKTNVTVSSDAPAVLEVTPGRKTVYVTAADPVLSPDPATGTSIADVEKLTFTSTLSALKTEYGFVMVGKSGKQQVMKSVSENDIPASNVFDIEMVRVVAKTQVKMGSDIDVSTFGFSMSMGDSEFRVSQTNDLMRMVADDSEDILSAYTDTDGDGTFDGYSVYGDLSFKPVVSGSFTPDGCHYMSENIVVNPMAGNTTFVSLCIPFVPEKYYSYSLTDGLAMTNETGVAGADFYAVGIVDESNGMEDFALDAATQHVIVFKTKEEADAYSNTLNGGDTSAITVSESEAPLRAPEASVSDINIREFKTLSFFGGKAYYRINIAGEDNSLKVERNKFYKVSVNSIKMLGFHSEDLLRPKDATSDPGNSASAWIGVVLSVADWAEVNQPVDLE